MCSSMVYVDWEWVPFPVSVGVGKPGLVRYHCDTRSSGCCSQEDLSVKNSKFTSLRNTLISKSNVKMKGEKGWECGSVTLVWHV